MNKWIATGYILNEIELRNSDNSISSCRISLSVKKAYAKDGDKYEILHGIAYGKTAEFASKYIKKGDYVGVTGKIQNNSGKNTDTMIIYIDNIEFINRNTKSSNDLDTNTQDTSKNYLEDDVLENLDIPF